MILSQCMSVVFECMKFKFLELQWFYFNFGQIFALLFLVHTSFLCYRYTKHGCCSPLGIQNIIAIFSNKKDSFSIPTATVSNCCARLFLKNFFQFVNNFFTSLQCTSGTVYLEYSSIQSSTLSSCLKKTQKTNLELKIIL